MYGSWTKLLPTNAWPRWAIVPVLAFVALATDRAYLNDFWHHLARGREIVQDGKLLDHDVFTFTVPGRAFQDVNWLSQVVYFKLFQWGGLDLVRAVNAALVAISLGWLVLLCRRKSGSLGIAAAVGIFTFFGLWQVLTIRPQTFSLLLFVLVYDLLDRAESRPALLLLIPLLVGLWANLHGAFPAGIMLVGCFLLAAAWQAWRVGQSLFCRPVLRLGACLAGSALATLGNPYGWRIYQYVGLTSNTAAARRIDEWVPPSLDLWIGRAFLVSLLVTFALFAINWYKHGRRPSARELILFGCFLPLACGSVRMVAWWLLICAPIMAVKIADRLSEMRSRPADKPAWDAAAAFAVLVLFVAFSMPGLAAWNPLLKIRQSTTRTEDVLERVHARMADHIPAGRIFSRFEWGEYLAWSFAPAHKIFMDGRIEIYPDEVWNAYASVTRGLPEWQAILDQYGVTALVLDSDYHARTGLLPRVEESGAWQRVFESGPSVLYVRRPGL